MEQIDFVAMAYGVFFLCLGGGGLCLMIMNRRVMKQLKALGDQ